MKRKALVQFRTSLFPGLLFLLFLSLAACEPEPNLDDTVIDDEEEEEFQELSGAVDLGLSVRWAECNVGADSPEEYGSYFAWGETKEKDNYLPSTYLYSDVNIGSDISGTDYDAAHVLLGDGWRMPTKEEFDELVNECDWQWTTEDSISGYEVTGPNGNSIFIPAAGYRYGTTVDYLGMRGEYGYYWSGTKLNTNKAYSLLFSSTKISGVDENGHNPYDGHTIRPVVGKGSASPKNILRLQEKDYSVSCKANEIDVELQTNVDFEYKILEASWVREQQSSSRALTIHNLVFEIDENTSRNIRKAQIIFYNAEYALSDTLTLVQEGNSEASSMEAVDLGLSVKWASCNIGAESPEEYGGYFAWGETEEKSDYSWATYKWCDGSYTSITKYCTSTNFGLYAIVDNKRVLDARDDVADVKWGGNWRMPTRDEVEELCSNCNWIWTTLNGISGYKIVAPNGNSIFLPAAGYRSDKYLHDRGSYGYYWTNQLYVGHTLDAYDLFFSGARYSVWDVGRPMGCPVRPVSE